MLDTSIPEVQVGIEAVRQAAKVAQTIQPEPGLIKPDRTPVTVADFAAQSVAARLLERAFPDVALVAEEGSGVLREPENEALLAQVTECVGRVAPDATPENVCAWIDHGNGKPAGRFWVMDPIDGTKGFLRGGQYAIALALIEGGQVQLAVMACPALGREVVPDFAWSGTLAIGARNNGAWAGPLEAETDAWVPLHVSDIGDRRQARLLRSLESGHTNIHRIEGFLQKLGTSRAPLPMDSAAKYVVLTSGHADLLCRFLSQKQPDYKERIWDQAAGALLVEEAGGRVTDLDGKNLDFTQGRTLANNRGLLASNGHLHEIALEAIARLG